MALELKYQSTNLTEIESFEYSNRYCFTICCPEQIYLSSTVSRKTANFRIQYKDFSRWQRSYLKGELLSSQEDYWKKNLLDYEPLALLTDHPRRDNICYVGDDVFFDLAAHHDTL